MSSAPKSQKINWLISMGDSLTNSDRTLYIPKIQQYPSLLQQSIGGYCRARNLGDPGDTTTEMLARFSAMLTPYKPTVATIYAGINDPGNGISDATTRSNLQSMIDQLHTAGCTHILLCNIHLPSSDWDVTRADIQTVATTNNIPVCDLRNSGLVAEDYQVDNLHLLPSGLQKLANKIKSTLDLLGWTDLLKN